MTWQFVNCFTEGSAAYLSNFLNFRGYLTAIVIILAGFHGWKKVSNWWWHRMRLIKFASTLPGPRTLPIIGNALQFACEAEDILDRIVDISTSYQSPFRVWLGPKLFIVTTNPRDYEIILASAKASYKDAVYRAMKPFIGQGLVSGSGPKHKAHRKIILPMLNSKVVANNLEYFDRHSRVCADLLEKEVDSGEFDISSYLTRCTMDIMMDTIMGSPGTTQENGHMDLVHWTERIYAIVHERMLKVWLHNDTIFSLTQLGKDHDVGINVVHRFTEEAIARKKEELRKNEKGDVEKSRNVLLDQLIAHIEKADDMSDEELRDEVYTVFTAAQDTTAVIASFTFLMLAMHQDIQDKVRHELTEILGSDSVREEHLPNLKYLEMVIRETIRLFPIAPLMVRQLRGDLELDTCTLPDGCSLVMVPFVTQRDPKYWKDPEKFVPERFLPENSVGRPQWANASFSGGIRGCIGQKFAIMCLKTVIVNIIRRYRLSTTAAFETLRIKTDISIRSRDGYKVSLTNVEQQ